MGGRFVIDGEALPCGIVSPPGEILHRISSGGRFVIWYSFRERLPYGILSRVKLFRGENSHVTPAP